MVKDSSPGIFAQAKLAIRPIALVFIAAGSLPAKLVDGEGEQLQAVLVIFVVQ